MFHVVHLCVESCKWLQKMLQNVFLSAHCKLCVPWACCIRARDGVGQCGRRGHCQRGRSANRAPDVEHCHGASRESCASIVLRASGKVSFFLKNEVISNSKLREMSNGLAQRNRQRVTQRKAHSSSRIRDTLRLSGGVGTGAWSSSTSLKASGGSAPEPPLPSRRCAY